jgi:5'-nucleotidase / UDP-sugar diphosphatase
MKKLPILLLFILQAILVSGQSEKKITILHTNDLHSRLTGYAPESAYSPLTVNDDKTIGGFARIATLIKSEKSNNTGITLAIDAGDFLMGTLFHSLESETGFQLRLMKLMGYDVTCHGNHEFDFGPEKLTAIINASLKGGEIPSLLIGNAVFDPKDGRDDGLEKLLSANAITRKQVFVRDGLKIGLFSMMGKDAVHVAPYAAPVTFAKQVSFAKQMVKELQAEKCDVIICVSHSGVNKDKNGNWVGEDADLAKAVKGIHLIISGHTHSKMDKPLIVNGIPIVQAGEYGQFVGRLGLIFSNGKLRVESYELIPVDDKIMGDAAINKLIDEQKERISSEILKPLGMSYNTPIVETGFPLECDQQGDFIGSNLGPLVADAVHAYVNGHGGKGTDVSLVSAGMIRDKMLPGIQTAPDIFRVMSLGSGKDIVPGYPLSRLYVTGKELKSILEILLVAYKSSVDNYCYYAGIRVDYNPEKGMLKKIQKIEIVHPDGSIANVDFSKRNMTLYSVTANSYMLEFIGIIKKMSHGLINVVPKDAAGNKVTDMKTAVIDMDQTREGIQEGKEWLALMEYLGSMKDTNGNGIPDMDKKYITSIQCFFPSAAK